MNWMVSFCVYQLYSSVFKKAIYQLHVLDTFI